MKKGQQNLPLNILLADDDKDDRFFFEKAVKRLSVATSLVTVTNGEQLLDYLLKKSETLPDVLFLDLNMPRKNGSECLEAIKSYKKFHSLPVIIYSTSLNETIADVLYQKGAHYYLRKRDLNELTQILEWIFISMIKNKFERPSRKEFILSDVSVCQK